MASGSRKLISGRKINRSSYLSRESKEGLLLRIHIIGVNSQAPINCSYTEFIGLNMKPSLNMIYDILLGVGEF